MFVQFSTTGESAYCIKVHQIHGIMHGFQFIRHADLGIHVPTLGYTLFRNDMLLNTHWISLCQKITTTTKIHNNPCNIILYNDFRLLYNKASHQDVKSYASPKWNSWDSYIFYYRCRKKLFPRSLTSLLHFYAATRFRYANFLSVKN